jgi:hypothetical protein
MQSPQRLLEYARTCLYEMCAGSEDRREEKKGEAGCREGGSREEETRGGGETENGREGTQGGGRRKKARGESQTQGVAQGNRQQRKHIFKLELKHCSIPCLVRQHLPTDQTSANLEIFAVFLKSLDLDRCCFQSHYPFGIDSINCQDRISCSFQ